jgi:hypothetical protein
MRRRFIAISLQENCNKPRLPLLASFVRIRPASTEGESK